MQYCNALLLKVTFTQHGAWVDGFTFSGWWCLISLTTSVVQFSHLLATAFFKTMKSVLKRCLNANLLPGFGLQKINHPFSTLWPHLHWDQETQIIYLLIFMWHGSDLIHVHVSRGKNTHIPLFSDRFQASIICGNKSDMNQIQAFASAILPINGSHWKSDDGELP